MTDLADDWRFLRGFLAKPWSVAALLPSGPRLAAAVAAQVEPGEGVVLELGPGTGAITHALLNRGVLAPRLVAIESDEEFVSLLRQRFPRANILEGNAFDFDILLERSGYDERLDAIISGLPVLGQPAEARRKFLRTALARLNPRAPFVQFSYGAWPPLPAMEGIDIHRAAVVWQNFPPMHIWTYRSAPTSAQRR